MGGHTPTPWHFTPSGSTMRDDYCQPFAVAEAGKPNLICGCFGDVAGGEDVAEANAAFIVEAVNSYDRHRSTINALVAALKESRSTIDALVGALEFYADPKRYEGPNQRPIENDPYAKPDDAYLRDVTRDGGDIARAALLASKEGR